MSAHPLEIAFLLISLVGVFATGYIFTLHLADLSEVRRRRVNGPMLFIARDNLRMRAFLMAVCAGSAALAVSSVTNSDPLNDQANNLMIGLMGISLVMVGEALFAYRRREKMALLIALYDGLPGGKRSTDPPAVEPAR